MLMGPKATSGGRITASSSSRFIQIQTFAPSCTETLQLYRPAGDATHETLEENDVWVDVATGKNSYIVTFSPLLSAALGCNTVQ
jgi:hypothetical protein